MIKSTDISNGETIILRNGWYGTMKDGQKRKNIRMAEVQGIYTEIGSIYVHDIVSVFRDGREIPVEHTDAQKNLRKKLTGIFV